MPVAGERRFLLFVLLAGVAIRLIWFSGFAGGLTAFAGSGEATRVALALARTGSFADAYYQGYGPTAHLLPVSPSIAGALMWLFGPASPAANLVLLGWSLAQVACAWLLLRRLFERLGFDPLVVRWGTVFLCLIAPFVPQETVDFRYWEGASALCLVCLNLLLLIDLEDSESIGWRPLLGVAALSAVTFFVCPPAGLAVDACWGVFAIRRIAPARVLGFALASAAALAVLIAPWAIRNAQVMGSPVLLRSNFGLELAMANHPAALSARPPEQVFADRLLQIHPYQSVPARAELARAGGEIAYSRALGDQARRWIAANPFGFARLSLWHLSEMFFPRPWQMYFTGWEGMRAPRAVTISLVSLFGLVGLAIGLYRRRRGFGILAIYLGVVVLPYALVQPIQRYIYLIYGLQVFLAVDALVRGYRFAKDAGWAR